MGLAGRSGRRASGQEHRLLATSARPNTSGDSFLAAITVDGEPDAPQRRSIPKLRGRAVTRRMLPPSSVLWLAQSILSITARLS